MQTKVIKVIVVLTILGISNKVLSTPVNRYEKPTVDTSRYSVGTTVRSANYWRKICPGVLVSNKCRYKLAYKVCTKVKVITTFNYCRVQDVLPAKYRD